MKFKLAHVTDSIGGFFRIIGKGVIYSHGTIDRNSSNISWICRQAAGQSNPRRNYRRSGGIVTLYLKINLIGWWAVNRWLQNFAYRIELSWLLLLYAASAVVIIAAVAIGIQAIRAAVANPVRRLRTE